MIDLSGINIMEREKLVDNYMTDLQEHAKNYTMSFANEHGHVGTIKWFGGKVTFEGNFDKSATQLFHFWGKHMNDKIDAHAMDMIDGELTQGIRCKVAERAVLAIQNMSEEEIAHIRSKKDEKDMEYVSMMDIPTQFNA
jgi:hypothetical protein